MVACEDGDVRPDPLAMATFWGVRSTALRVKHGLSNAELAHLFGGEWGLDVPARVELLARLMNAPAVTK